MNKIQKLFKLLGEKRWVCVYKYDGLRTDNKVTIILNGPLADWNFRLDFENDDIVCDVVCKWIDSLNDESLSKAIRDDL